MNIKKATSKDFNKLYKLGLKTKEFQVNPNELFMAKDEFESRIKDKNDLLLLAEENNKILGFILFGLKDADRPMKNKCACLTYLVVNQKYRKKGIAQILYNESIKKLKKKKIKIIYGWACEESKSIRKFVKKQGFLEGNKYIWIEKKL